MRLLGNEPEFNYKLTPPSREEHGYGFLLVLRGLPASGKTTYAKTLIKDGWVRLSRDNYREMLWSGYFDRQREDLLVFLMIRDARWLLRNGYKVVLDNLHLDPVHLELARNCVKPAFRYFKHFQVKNFDTDVETCIQWNACRSEDNYRKVPENVIKALAKKWNWPRESGKAK